MHNPIARSVVNPQFHSPLMKPWLTPRAASILWNLLCLTAGGLGAVFTILALAKGTV
jgi:hypothetical protein